MGLLGQLAAGPVARPAPRTPSGHVLSGPPSPQHARGPQVAPNRAPASGGSARITGPTAFPASQQDAYRRAIAETFLHQSQPTQIALIHGAMKNPTPAGTTILDFLKGTGVSKVIGHSLLYTGPGATKNVSYPYGMQSQTTPSSSPTTPGAAAATSLSGNVTPTGFAQALLKGLGAPVTPQNMQALVGWQKAEGGNWNNTATFNPLNTTQPAPGAGNTGAQGNIKQYTSWDQGLQATIKTLNNGQYGQILSALKAGTDPSAVAQAIGSSPWGTTASGAAQAIASTPPPAGGANQLPTGAAPQAASAPQTPQASVFGRQVPKAQAKTYTQAQGALQQLAGDVPLSVHTTLNAATQAGAQAAGGKGLMAVIGAANAIAANHYNYEWGGGHNPQFSPAHGSGHGSGAGTGFDCSGAISAILHAAGLLKQPLVASEFMSYGQAGAGGPQDVTIYASPSHVFAKIGAKYFGTSGQNPGGGAAWFNHGYTSGFTVRHVTP